MRSSIGLVFVCLVLVSCRSRRAQQQKATPADVAHQAETKKILDEQKEIFDANYLVCRAGKQPETCLEYADDFSGVGRPDYAAMLARVACIKGSAIACQVLEDYRKEEALAAQEKGRVQQARQRANERAEDAVRREDEEYQRNLQEIIRTSNPKQDSTECKPTGGGAFECTSD